MVRPKNIRNRASVNHVFDMDYYKEFTELVGSGNVSEELRAFIKDRVDQSKNEEGLTRTPLNLPIVANHPKNSNITQYTIFQDFDKKDCRDELVQMLNLDPDMHKLNIIYKNCNAAVGTINRRKIQEDAIAKAEKRKNMPTNAEIESMIKAERRRTRV